MIKWAPQENGGDNMRVPEVEGFLWGQGLEKRRAIAIAEAIQKEKERKAADLQFKRGH